MTTLRWAAVAASLAVVGCKSEPAPAASGTATAALGARVVELKVTSEGFEPTPVKVKKGEPLVLKVTRTTDKTCANEILIEGTDINVPLPLNQAVEVRYTPTKAGELRYGCGMGMMVAGVLLVE